MRILSVRGVHPPFTDKKFAQKSYEFGGYPSPPPLRTIPRKFSSNRAKNCVFLPKKHLFLVQKIGYGYRGYPSPPPLRTKSAKYYLMSSLTISRNNIVNLGLLVTQLLRGDDQCCTAGTIIEIPMLLTISPID